MRLGTRQNRLSRETLGLNENLKIRGNIDIFSPKDFAFKISTHLFALKSA
jgi:hypothetical protein